MNTTNKIDIVYVLGNGSTWENNELRYSLRSVTENLEGTGKVYIIGEKPSFVKNIKYIPCPDEIGEHNADGNIICKLLRACQEEKLTNEFLVINDDSFIISPVKISEIKYFHKGDLKNFNKRPGYFDVNNWRKRLGRTKDILINKKLTTLHFDCYLPVLVNKKLFVEIFNGFNFREGLGYTWKSIYCNAAKVNAEILKSMKYALFLQYTPTQIEKRLRYQKFMSVNDNGLTDFVKDWLNTRFPNQCKYEKVGK